MQPDSLVSQVVGIFNSLTSLKMFLKIKLTCSEQHTSYYWVILWVSPYKNTRWDRQKGPVKVQTLKYNLEFQNLCGSSWNPRLRLSKIKFHSIPEFGIVITALKFNTDQTHISR